MKSLTDVKRESQGNRPLYFNIDDQGVSLGVLYFGLAEILDAAEASLELVAGVQDQPDMPSEYGSRLLLVKLGLEHIIKCQGDLYPFADQGQREFRCERHAHGPMTITFEKRGAE